MKNHTLPLAFKSFEKWVSDWSVPHESGRFNKRVSTEMSDLNDFVVALQGVVEQMIDHLNTMPTADPDTQLETGPTISLRTFSLISFESQSFVGHGVCDFSSSLSNSATPTATGPAIAPRPTSSMPITKRAPLAHNSFSKLRLGYVFEDIRKVV